MIKQYLLPFCEIRFELSRSYGQDDTYSVYLRTYPYLSVSKNRVFLTSLAVALHCLAEK